MERKEILKSAGFSQTFLDALDEYEKTVPEISFEAPPVFANDIEIKNSDTSGQLTITKPSDDYNYNLIVRQF